MGNCETACCGEDRTEVPMSSDIRVGDKKTRKKGASNTNNGTTYYDSLDDNAFFKRNLEMLIKIQSIWRGKIARNKFITLKLTAKTTSKYFTEADRKETIKEGKKYKAEGRKKRQHHYKSGAVYDGEWKGGFRDGYGVQIWADDAKYEGSWRDGRAHGRGTFTHPNGDVYEGEWANDKMSKYGIYTHTNGSTYEGQWKDDQQNGKGIEKWQDGSRYEGQFYNGSKHGVGKYKWPDGSKFEGQWVNNKISGYGFYTWNDGRSFKGEWKDNCMHGYGFYQWKDGRSYEGQYKNDLKHGFGIYYFADGRVYEGYWANNKQHGLGVYTTPKEKTPKFGLWENGKRTVWFDEDSVKLINKGSDKWIGHLKDPESENTVDRSATLNRPKGFDLKMIEVQDHLNKI